MGFEEKYPEVNAIFIASWQRSILSTWLITIGVNFDHLAEVFVHFLNCSYFSFPPFHDALFRRVSLCIAHTSGVGNFVPPLEVRLSTQILWGSPARKIHMCVYITHSWAFLVSGWKLRAFSFFSFFFFCGIFWLPIPLYLFPHSLLPATISLFSIFGAVCFVLFRFTCKWDHTVSFSDFT